MDKILTLEELESLLKDNPLRLPVFYEMDRVPKNSDFIYFEKIEGDPVYADNYMYAKLTDFAFYIYTGKAKNRDLIDEWFTNKFNVPGDFSKEDFFYKTTYKREFFIKCQIT